MKPSAAAVQAAKDSKKTVKAEEVAGNPSITAKRVDELREKASSLRIRAIQETQVQAADPAPAATPEIRAARKEEFEDEPVLMLTPANAAPVRKSVLSRAAGYAGFFLSVAWLSACASYIVANGGMPGDLPQFGMVLTAMLAPLALLWTILNQIRRGSDIQQYAQALRGELQSIIFPSDDRAQRVSKDIERLCQQAAELAASSRTVIKAIARARHGLRTEVRDFVGVSKKTEFHIDRLAETLNERAAKLLALTEEIETRTATIGEKTLAGTGAWDEATKAILARATEMEDVMGKGADKILAAAAQAGEKAKDVEKHFAGSFDSLNGEVDRVADRLKDLTGGFDEHIKGLSDAAAHVSTETDRLSGAIRRQIESLEGVATNTIGAMEKSSRAVMEHREALDRSTENLAAQANRISDTIKSSLAGMDEAADSMVSRTGEIEGRIDAQAEKLRETARGLSKDAEAIEEAGISAASKLGEAMGTALSGAESISAAVRRSVEGLEKATLSAREHAESLIASTHSHVEKLNEAGEGNVEHIKTIVELLEKSREQIAAAAGLAEQQVERLSESVNDQTEKINLSTASMVERVDAVHAALERPLRQMSTAVAEADTLHGHIGETLRKRVAELEDVSGKARESADHIRNVMRGQVQEISTLSGQIAVHARNINTQIAEQKDTLGVKVVETLKGVGQVRDALESQSARLAALSDKAVADIAALQDNIAARCREVGDTTAQAVADLEKLDQSIETKVSALRERSGDARESVQTVMDALDRTASGFEPVFTGAMAKAQEAQQRFVTLHEGFETSTASNLEKLQTIGILFDERLQNLRSGADAAAGILESSSNHLHERVGEIERAAQSASDKMRDIERSLADQSSDIHLTTDQALLKIGNVQRCVNEQFQELSEAVGRAMVQIGDVNGEIGKSTAGIDEAVNRIVVRFDDAGTRALVQSEKLNDAAAMSVNLSGELVSRVQREAQELLGASKETLMELKRTGDSFAARTKELSEHMKSALKVSQNYNEELRGQADRVAEVSALSADRVSKAVSVLSARLDEINTVAGAVAGNIADSREDLAQESERLITVSNAAIRAADEASATFGKQSGALFKAVQDAVHHAEKIRKEEGRVQRDAFMSAAKFIVESLHSLSVDFTRMLEGEVQEKTWKAFQKGDIGAFTRRLAAMGDDLPVEKIRTKYADDGEFRTYVQRFLRQFEELFDQAAANDHSDLLGSTFVSSDVGRLYTVLCTAAGREPRTRRGDRIAA